MTTGSGAAGWRTTKKSRTHLLPSQNCDSQRNHSARVPVRPSCQGPVALNRCRCARRANFAGEPVAPSTLAVARSAEQPHARASSGTPVFPQLAHRIGIADSTLRQSRPRHHLPGGHRSTPREQALNGRPARRSTPPPSGPATSPSRARPSSRSPARPRHTSSPTASTPDRDRRQHTAPIEAAAPPARRSPLDPAGTSAERPASTPDNAAAVRTGHLPHRNWATPCTGRTRQ